MNSMHFVNMGSIVDEPEEKLHSSSSVDIDDLFGDPQVLPRIGHQYQADIPPLISKYDCLQLVNGPTTSEILLNIQNCVSLGLPIPIVWKNIVVENKNGTVEFENTEDDMTQKAEESQIGSNNEDVEPKAESLDVLLNEQDVAGYSNLQTTTKSDMMDVDVALPEESKTNLDQLERGLCPLPGSVAECWTEIECESFLLGLYIFAKNLNLVKRFVESKGMGDILCFYYGKFYRSDGYRRWSECRKLRSKRFVHGQKIFTGWRQQELLSRFFSLVSEECKKMLLEDSRKFIEGKISFEGYIFSLKKAVGINNLIEAVGIGMGKKDLTGTAMEPVKTNQVFPVQPEIPFGKVCSSLTSDDIIRFLTGDFRLSKARASDLFWEAVWPRLLARGWHSEQPKDHSFANSKNSLVFLIPGVKKFSRRKLVKGEHYFDSVSDVLNKVASEPGLLELQIDACKSNEVMEEDSMNQSAKQVPDGLSNKQHHCYLQPRKSSNNRHLMQFTIVDTSLLYRGGQSKVRELRSLPVEASTISTPSLSSESEDDTSDESEDEEEETNIPNAEDLTATVACAADSSDCANGMSDTHTFTNAVVENHTNQSTSPFDYEQQKSSVEFQFCPKANSGYPICVASVARRQDLVVGINGESSCNNGSISIVHEVDENEFGCRSNLPNGCEDMVFQLVPQDFAPAIPLAKDSPDRRHEGKVSENHLEREVSLGKNESHTPIDLNIPQVSLDIGNNELSKDMEQNNDCFSGNKLSVVFESRQQNEEHEESKLTDDKSGNVQQPIVSNRRQSTRNRPLTTKALEAFAFGYLSPKRKKRDEDALQTKAKSRPSRRVRSKTVVSGTTHIDVGIDVADFRTENSLDTVCGNSNVVDGIKYDGL